MAGWIILPVPAFLTQSIFYPPSVVPEGKTITEASKELGFRGRQRLLLPAIGAQVMAETAGVGAATDNMATPGSLCMKII